MNAYFDTSGLIKLLIREEGSQTAKAAWDDADGLFAARIAYPECRAALAAARRAGRLSEDQLGRAKAELQTHWQSLAIIELTEHLAGRAGEVAELFSLRGYDSVHLSAALSLESDKTVAVTWDDELARAALDAGLMVAPAVAADP